MALKRVQALQQRECSAAPEATQNPPEEAVGDQKGGVAYTDQDRKILQLCGEDLAAAGRGGARTCEGGATGGKGRGWAGPTLGRGGGLAGAAAEEQVLNWVGVGIGGLTPLEEICGPSV